MWKLRPIFVIFQRIRSLACFPNRAEMTTPIAIATVITIAITIAIAIAIAIAIVFSFYSSKKKMISTVCWAAF